MTVPALPALTPAQAAEMYRVAEERFHVPMDLVLENGGRVTAALVQRLAPSGGRIVILVGKGFNGADALAAARHLVVDGWDVEVGLAVPPVTLTPFSRKLVESLEAQGARVRETRTDPPDLTGAGLILDGLLGCNARGKPRPPMDVLVAGANAADGTVRLSLDVPTGVDPTTGELNGEAFRADATLMLGLPKTGTMAAGAAGHAGELHLADGSLPRGVYAHFATERPAFDREGLMALPR